MSGATKGGPWPGSAAVFVPLCERARVTAVPAPLGLVAGRDDRYWTAEGAPTLAYILFKRFPFTGQKMREAGVSTWDWHEALPERTDSIWLLLHL